MLEGEVRVRVGMMIEGEWVETWSGISDGRFLLPPETQLAMGLQALAAVRRRTVTEKKDNPTKRKSQDSDAQDKDTVERVEKQDVTKETTGERGAGDFITGTATPNKEG